VVVLCPAGPSRPSPTTLFFLPFPLPPHHHIAGSNSLGDIISVTQLTKFLKAFRYVYNVALRALARVRGYGAAIRQLPSRLAPELYCVSSSLFIAFSGGYTREQEASATGIEVSALGYPVVAMAVRYLASTLANLFNFLCDMC